MKYNIIPRTKLKVSELCLGTWQFSNDSNFNVDRADSKRIIREAIELGINFFDTGESYGKGLSEEILGEALQGVNKEIVISTKVREYNLDSKSLVNSIELSLKRLKRECIDIYHVHWPTKQVPFIETFETMKKLQVEGKIRYIGVSNFAVDELKEACDITDIVTIQNPYSVLWRCNEQDTHKFCKEHEIGILAYSPLAQGLLTERFQKKLLQNLKPSQQENVLYQENLRKIILNILKKLEVISKNSAINMSQLAISWLLNKPEVVSTIIGVTTIEQLRANIDTVNLELSEELMNKTNDISDILINYINDDYKRSMWNWWPDKDREGIVEKC